MPERTAALLLLLGGGLGHRLRTGMTMAPTMAETWGFRKAGEGQSGKGLAQGRFPLYPTPGPRPLTPTRPHAHRISPRASGRSRPQCRLPRGPADAWSSRARRRSPISGPARGSWASWPPSLERSGSTSTRRRKSPPSPASCCGTIGCPTAASPKCTRPTWPSPTASTWSSPRRSATIRSRRTSSARSTMRASAS